MVFRPIFFLISLKMGMVLAENRMLDTKLSYVVGNRVSISYVWSEMANIENWIFGSEIGSGF